jgi:hypothetical protein
LLLILSVTIQLAKAAVLPIKFFSAILRLRGPENYASKAYIHGCFIDADEVVPVELAAEIRETIERGMARRYCIAAVLYFWHLIWFAGMQDDKPCASFARKMEPSCSRYTNLWK